MRALIFDKVSKKIHIVKTALETAPDPYSCEDFELPLLQLSLVLLIMFLGVTLCNISLFGSLRDPGGFHTKGLGDHHLIRSGTCSTG